MGFGGVSNMNENKRNGGLFGKGYYIALILCAVAIGITGYVYNRNQHQNADLPANANPTDSTLSAVVEHEDDVAVIATRPAKETEVPFSESTEPSRTRQGLKTMSPVSGQTLMDYSMEALSYNQTTRDWRVHNGIDIAAEEGTPVLASADGQVMTICEDDTLGTTVVIRHTGGYTTQYASLSEDVAVKVGDTVVMGQTIGTVGATALVETAMGPHLHFSVTYQDQPMNPADFLSLGE